MTPVSWPAARCRRGTCFAELAKLSAPVRTTSTTSNAAQQPAAAFKPLKRPAGLLHAGSGKQTSASEAAGTAAAAGPASRAAGGGGHGGLFDPTAPGAVVVNAAQWQDGKGVLPKGWPVVPVVSSTTMSLQGGVLDCLSCKAQGWPDRLAAALEV